MGHPWETRGSPIGDHEKPMGTRGRSMEADGRPSGNLWKSMGANGMRDREISIQAHGRSMASPSKSTQDPWETHVIPMENRATTKKQ